MALLVVAAAWLVAGAVVHPGLLESLPWHLLVAAWVWAWGSAWRLPAVRALGVAGCALWLVLATPAGANALLNQVELPVQAAACARDSDRTHVLLAGGLGRAPRDERDVFVMTEASLLRTGRWLQQFGADDARTLVISGGGAFGEARLMAEMLRGMGRPESRTRWEVQSHNTADSAAALAAGAAGAGRRIVLSTSALHQRRASVLFRALGFDVCENPLYSDYIPPGTLGYYWPQTSAMRKAEAVLHELGGLVVAKLELQPLAGRVRQQLARWGLGG